MKFKKPSRKQILSSSNEVGPDDGVDPRVFFRKTSRAKVNHRALRLCTQIARTLSSILAWESGDDQLRNMTVLSVEPAPDATRLLITLGLPGLDDSFDNNLALEQLRRSAGKFRTEIAAAIHRKRAPELVFRIVRSGEVSL